MSKSDRSLAGRTGVYGGRRKRWPLDLDTHDPESIASFTLGLGYDEESVVTTLVKRCNLDRITARSIVRDVAHKPLGGSQ